MKVQMIFKFFIDKAVKFVELEGNFLLSLRIKVHLFIPLSVM